MSFCSLRYDADTRCSVGGRAWKREFEPEKEWRVSSVGMEQHAAAQQSIMPFRHLRHLIYLRSYSARAHAARRCKPFN